jgi:hypothetical protein
MSRKAIGTVSSAQEPEITAGIGTAEIAVEIEVGVPPQIATRPPEANDQSVQHPPTGIVIFLTSRRRSTHSSDRKCKKLGKRCTRNSTNAPTHPHLQKVKLVSPVATRLLRMIL